MPARQEGAPHLDLARFLHLTLLNPPYLRVQTLSCPFLPPAPCLASPFLSTDVAKRADGTRSRGRRAVFFLSLSPYPSIPMARFDGTTRRQRRGEAHGHESPRPPRTALSQQREEISMSRRGRAASEGRGRRCNRAAGNRQPPFHAFLHLHTCAFSLISSACFLWQVTASMRRREGQALRRKRPRYTKPATHGRLLASFLAPICTPIDL